jgi:prevent-host-death family protein
MLPHWSLQDAKNKFSEVVNAAQSGNPQIVTKRGVPAVVVLSAETYKSIVRQERLTRNFADFLLSMPTDHEGDPSPATLRLREVDW